MRIIRNTLYIPPGMEPMTITVKELDVSSKKPAPGMFHVVDVFEAPDDTSDVTASLLSARRQQEEAEDEMNMAILFYWDQMALETVNPGGVLSASKPAPLTVEQLEYTLKLLAHSPAYKGQTILVISKDLQLVRMVNGEVRAELVQ